MTSLQVVLLVGGIVLAVTWLLSVVTRDSSWVDRIWSVVPVAYLWIFAGSSGGDPRLVLVAVLVTLWGARLTVNFARRGGYTGTEDYRWPVLRSRMRPWQYQVFQLVFIAGFQNALLVAITLPGWTMHEHPGGLGASDVVLAAVFLVLLAGETIADQQQWDFHRRKHAAQAAGRDTGPGFATTGLFRYSRHPNFFCEVGQWWVVFAFGAMAAGTPWLWTAAGAIVLTGLFVGSTRFTESLSAAKYPQYADYQRRTSMLVPWPPRAVGEVAA